MAKGFRNLTLRASDLPLESAPTLAFRSGRGLAPPSNESVARQYIDLALQRHESEPTFRGLQAIDRPERVPALEVVEELRSPFGENAVLRLRQRHNRIPVFGARATVEINPSQGLEYLDIEVADADELDAAAAPASVLSPHEALEKLAGILEVASGDFPSPELVYFRDHGSEQFRLCWLFRRVPVTPAYKRAAKADSDVEASHIGGWEASRHRLAVYNYFVDANDGALVSAQTASRSFEVPVECTGEDEDEHTRTFDGKEVPAGFAMEDPVRQVATYNFDCAVYGPGDPPCGDPVSNATTDWADTNRAAVTAHYHATVVYDFIESVLHRQGVDGKQMALTSIVNCAADPNNPEWPNAQWTGQRMIYGQTRVGGRLVSLARHLDVIAHELTHGITEHSADLEYEFESGALDESMSDIFGIAVGNLTAGRHDPRQWSWEIGPGLGASGGPLRDMEDPSRGTPPQPSHTKDWVSLSIKEDFGGVHFNSGIHNRAAYLVFTAELTDGTLAMTPEEVARCYYFVLLQLTRNAGFGDTRKKLVETLRTRKQGNANRDEIVSAVEAAYDAVGVA